MLPRELRQSPRNRPALVLLGAREGNIDHEVVADHSCDLEKFMVQPIALDIPSVARGSRMNFGLSRTLMLSLAAKLGAISLRPAGKA